MTFRLWLLFLVLPVGINTDESHDQLSGPELAAKMTIGTRVVRGDDWKSDTQDFAACVGTVIRIQDDYNYRTEVTWDNGQTKDYLLRDGHYLLQLADPPGSDVSDQSNIFTVPLLRLLTFGTRVVRGVDWPSYWHEDYFACDGTVVSEVDVDGMIRVKWKNGSTESHHMGKDGLFELKLYVPYHPMPWLLELYQERQSRVMYTGSEVRKMMAIGTRVVRGLDWGWGHQDYSESDRPGTVIKHYVPLYGLYVRWDDGLITSSTRPFVESVEGSNVTITLWSRVYRLYSGKVYAPGPGTVVAMMPGWISVLWDNGKTNFYRMGYNGKYDVTLADPPKPGLPGIVSNETGPEIAAKMTIGTRVMRGYDWVWRKQDYSGYGIVVSKHEANGYVWVYWPETLMRHTMRGTYELNLAEPPDGYLSGSELFQMMIPGMRVVRGVDWDPFRKVRVVNYPGHGTVVRELNGWIGVLWDGGDTNFYRMGKDGQFELKRVTQEPDLAGSPSPPQMQFSGKQLVSMMTVGRRVCRGVDWIWGKQDYSPGSGISIHTANKYMHPNLYTRYVKWDQDYTGSHVYKQDFLSIYNTPKLDKLRLAEPPEYLSAITSNTTDESLTAAWQKQMMGMWTRVVRGPAWNSENEDYSAGSGTVISEVDSYGIVGVTWDNNNTRFYRMGYDGRYDLKLAARQGTELPELASMETGTQLNSSILAAMTEGARVVRGDDWIWDTQDYFEGHGTVVSSLDALRYVHVTWDNGNTHEYKMGASNEYELNLVEPPEPLPNKASEEFAGSELGQMMTLWTRVARGVNWKSGEQDYIARPGTVINVISGWVNVTWDNGKTNLYRMGYDGKYDLKLETQEVELADKIPSLTGTELVAKMRMGTRVVRGADWRYAKEDYTSGVGTVVSKIDSDDRIMITWDNGYTHIYRIGTDGQYDLKPVTPPKLSGVESNQADNQLSGLKLIPTMTLWARVVRGVDWRYGQEDYFAGPGTVVSEVDSDGMIWVTWDNGHTGEYRMGKNGQHDLKLDERPEAQNAGSKTPVMVTPLADITANEVAATISMTTSYRTDGAAETTTAAIVIILYSVLALMLAKNV